MQRRISPLVPLAHFYSTVQSKNKKKAVALFHLSGLSDMYAQVQYLCVPQGGVCTIILRSCANSCRPNLRPLRAFKSYRFGSIHSKLTVCIIDLHRDHLREKT